MWGLSSYLGKRVFVSDDRRLCFASFRCFLCRLMTSAACHHCQKLLIELDLSSNHLYFRVKSTGRRLAFRECHWSKVATGLCPATPRFSRHSSNVRMSQKERAPATAETLPMPFEASSTWLSLVGCSSAEPTPFHQVFMAHWACFNVRADSS